MTRTPSVPLDPNMHDGHADGRPRRVSALAVTALVMGLLCCVPGVNTMGLILGGASLVVISRSGGRLTGTGLAIAGIILGLAGSLAWIGGAVMMQKGAQAYRASFAAPVATAMEGIEQGNYQPARVLLVPSSGNLVSEEDYATFVAASRAELGAFAGIPKSSPRLMLRLAVVTGAFAEAFPDVQGRRDVILVPANFATGQGAFVVQVDPNMQRGQTGQSLVVPVLNLGVYRVGDQPIWLIDPAATSPKAPLPGRKAAPVAPGASPAPAPADGYGGAGYGG